MDDFHSSSSCDVSGALSFALRMSQIFGIAPLRFAKLRATRRVCVSRALYIYGNFLAVVSSSMSLVTLLIVVYVQPEEFMLANSRGDQIVYFVDLALLSLVAVVAASTGTTRMNHMISYLNQIHKINLDLASCYSHLWRERREWMPLLLLLTIGCLTFVLEFTSFMQMVARYGIMEKYAAYWSIHILYFIRMIAQIQFAIIAMTVLGTFKRLNECLRSLLREIQLEEESSKKSVIIMSRAGLKINNYTIPVKSINKIIDTMQIPEQINKVPEISSSKATHERLHILARMYGSLCEVVRKVDRSHGPLLLCLVFSYFVHLVIMLYYTIVSFLADSCDSFNSKVHFFWVLYLMSGMYVVIEPCHQTQNEMGTTKELISKMTQNTSSNDELLPIELELFFQQVMLTEAVYAPMKMCTLNRSLAISIFSSMATYLVVVLQF